MVCDDAAPSNPHGSREAKLKTTQLRFREATIVQNLIAPRRPFVLVKNRGGDDHILAFLPAVRANKKRRSCCAAAKMARCGHEETSIVRSNVMQLSSMRL
jgi:hypothetical protein